MSNPEDAPIDAAGSTTRTIVPRALAVLLAVCVVGRGAYALYLVHTNAIVTDSGDAPTYLGPARQLLEHGRFNSGDPTSQSEFLRTPGYPAFLAAVFRVFGETISRIPSSGTSARTLQKPRSARACSSTSRPSRVSGCPP